MTTQLNSTWDSEEAAVVGTDVDLAVDMEEDREDFLDTTVSNSPSSLSMSYFG